MRRGSMSHRPAKTLPMNRLHLAIAASVIIFCGCAIRSHTFANSWVDRRVAEDRVWLRKKLEFVSLNDGVDQYEAQQLAEAYWFRWYRFYNGCSMAGRVKDRGTFWKAPMQHWAGGEG